MTQLRIDNVAKTVDVELMLQGEKEPISIHIGQYQLSTSGESPTLTIGQITISRQWMEALAADYLKDKPLPLDPRSPNGSGSFCEADHDQVRPSAADCHPQKERLRAQPYRDNTPP